MRNLFGGAVLASQSALGGGGGGVVFSVCPGGRRGGVVCSQSALGGGGGELYVLSLPAMAAVILICCQSAMDRWFYVLSPFPETKKAVAVATGPAASTETSLTVNCCVSHCDNY